MTASRIELLARLQGAFAESLGLWAAEEPDLGRLEALAAEAAALAAALAAAPSGDAASELAAAREAERLRGELAAASALRLEEERGAWARERRGLDALRGAYAAPAAAGARFLDRRQ